MSRVFAAGTGWDGGDRAVEGMWILLTVSIAFNEKYMDKNKGEAGT